MYNVEDKILKSWKIKDQTQAEEQIEDVLKTNDHPLLETSNKICLLDTSGRFIQSLSKNKTPGRY